MKTKPQKVTWGTSDELICAKLASLGMSTKKIIEETVFSACQVSYRLKLADIKRSDYRNGTSATAQRVIDVVFPRRDADVRAMLKLKLREGKG